MAECENMRFVTNCFEQEHLHLNGVDAFLCAPGMGVIFRVKVPNCEGRSNS